jgi:hypothetical protein
MEVMFVAQNTAQMDFYAHLLASERLSAPAAEQ